MRDNYSVSIAGSKVTLVPYRHKFVETYNEWMKDPYILEMTASEPLTLQEEYDMQKSWKEDKSKCTFIILATGALNKSTPQSNVDDREIFAMAGDVNLFLNDRDDSGNAEIDVMIAECKYRRQGFAEEAVSMIMKYGVERLGIHRFYAKINETNKTSRDLFTRLGYTEVNYVAAFKEYEYEFRLLNDDTSGVPCAVPDGSDVTTDHAALIKNRDLVLSRASHAQYLAYSEPDHDEVV